MCLEKTTKLQNVENLKENLDRVTEYHNDNSLQFNYSI